MVATSKKIIIVFFVIITALFSFSAPIFAAEDFSNEPGKIIIHLFETKGCPICQSAERFIYDLKQDYPDIELRIYPISDTQKLSELARDRGVEDYRTIAPTIFIGDSFFQIIGTSLTSNDEEMIIAAIEGEIVGQDFYTIEIPFINIEVDIKDWSLPLVTIILGSLDGFNVCSMGALILVLSIIIIFNSRKKMFIYGGLFIITVVIIYGGLVFVWAELADILSGQLEILRIIVGAAAFCGSIYFFKEFWRFFKYGPSCQISDSALIKKATNKLKESFEVSSKGPLYLTGSVIIFAAVITIVELPCSIGLPMMFVAILAEAGISSGSGIHILYVLAYLFFYMLIEIVIFTGAVLTKTIWFAGSKLITWIYFIGALILLYLSYYYLFS